MPPYNLIYVIHSPFETSYPIGIGGIQEAKIRFMVWRKG